MKKQLIFLGEVLFFTINLFGQNNLPETKIMTLGVFHFAYPNLDAVKTLEKDKISVLDEPYHSEILSISNAICDFKPTIIAIEANPAEQNKIDSLYILYMNNKFNLEKDEIYQLGFRIGKNLNLPKIYCVNNWGRHYDNVEAIFKDSTRLIKFEEYYFHSPDSIYKTSGASTKVSSVIDELKRANDPAIIKDRLSAYLLNPFKFEEQPGDFTGVDFETGRWFNRNLRIFRNIQRIPHTADDRVLLIIGSEHLNLLNLFLDTSKEFELVSPLPYLERAKTSPNPGQSGLLLNVSSI